jgi:hypothetical protein
MTITSTRRMPDGTICRTGPGCKRHGGATTVTLQNDIGKRLETARKAVKERDKSLPFPEGTKRVGLNKTDPDWALDLHNQSQEIDDSLDVSSANGLGWYRMGGYIATNAFLRGGKEAHDKAVLKDMGSSSSSVSEEYLKSSYERTVRHVEQVDQVFKDHQKTFDTPMPVYRAIRVEEEIPEGVSTLQYIKDKYKPGSEVVENSYVSTSADSDYMAFFGRKRVKAKGTHIVYEIIAKKGLPIFQRGYGATPSRPSDGDIQSFEREILLERGSKFRVVGVKNASFEHSYSQENQGLGSYVRDCPKKVTFPVVQLEQIV